jgi:hypothetical protein
MANSTPKTPKRLYPELNLLDRGRESGVKYLNHSSPNLGASPGANPTRPLYHTLDRSLLVSAPNDDYQFQSKPSSPLPKLGSLANPGGGNLGSLAQQAREKEIRQAKWALVAAGVILLISGLFEMVTARAQVQAEIEKQVQQVGGWANVRRAEVARAIDDAVSYVYVLDGLLGIVGVLFIVLGMWVRMYPLPITIVGLSLFLLINLGLVLVDPLNLMRGFIVKIIIIAALIRAIKAASAYEKERDPAPELEPGF